MTDETPTLAPQSPATPHGNGQRPAGEAAFLVRARRVLAGDVLPEDYLSVTPEVQARVDRDVGFLVTSGRVREPVDLDRSVAIRQRNGHLLSHHHGGENVAYIEDESGVIVLAVGLEQTGVLLDAIPHERRKDVCLGTPDPF